MRLKFEHTQVNNILSGSDGGRFLDLFYFTKFFAFILDFVLILVVFFHTFARKKLQAATASFINSQYK